MQLALSGALMTTFDNSRIISRKKWETGILIILIEYTSNFSCTTTEIYISTRRQSENIGMSERFFPRSIFPYPSRSLSIFNYESDIRYLQIALRVH